MTCRSLQGNSLGDEGNKPGGAYHCDSWRFSETRLYFRWNSAINAQFSEQISADHANARVSACMQQYTLLPLWLLLP